VEVEHLQHAKAVPRATFGWKDDDLIIGCIGRLEPEKGQTVLLQAFDGLHRRHPRTRLLLVGDGGERARLERTAASLRFNGAIRFVGTREDVPELLATCDIVALPSFHEGLPMALLEAMAAGRPVVASAVGGVPHLIRDGETGVLVAPGDHAALQEALGRLAEDEATRRRLAASAMRLVEERFGFDRTLQRYEELYREVLG
jgi:glycosyltransferase involved in cell wall biosynthesis